MEWNASKRRYSYRYQHYRGRNNLPPSGRLFDRDHSLTPPDNHTIRARNTCRFRRRRRDAFRPPAITLFEIAYFFIFQDHDVVFWFGDLNYRIEASIAALEVLGHAVSGGFPFLAANDQLNSAREAGAAFDGFHEGKRPGVRGRTRCCWCIRGYGV